MTTAFIFNPLIEKVFLLGLFFCVLLIPLPPVFSVWQLCCFRVGVGLLLTPKNSSKAVKIAAL